MTSYLIVGKSKNAQEEAYEALFDSFTIDPLDITRIGKPDDTKPDKARKTTKSIGIEDVKKNTTKIIP